MANRKLRKPLLLQEEFAAGEVSNPNQNATPAVQTNTNTVGIDKTSTSLSGEEVRAEIVKDVDTILTNLEALSKQITEEVLSEVDETIKTIFESEFTEPVNEDFMAELIKQAKSMKAYGVLKSSYPKLKKNLADAKANKIESEAEFDLNSDEKIGDLKDKIKAKYQKAIDKINANPDLPTPKKKAQRDAIYQARDEALSPEKSQLIKDKIAAEKSKLQKKNDAAIRDVNTAITELTGENKIEAELMMKKWDKEKIEIDDQFDQEAIDTELELKMKYSAQDPEAQKKLQARLDKRSKEEGEEKARRAKEAEEDLKAYQAKMKEEDANASADEKEARAKVNAFISSSQALIGALTGGDKEKIKEANKTYTEAKAAATDGVYKATQEGMSDDDAKEAKLQIETAVDQALEKYKVTLREITTDQKKKDDDKYEMTDDDRLKVSDEEKQRDERQAQLDAELAKPEEERNQDKIDGLKAGIAKNNQDIADIKAGKKAGNESVEVEETEKVNEGLHPKLKKAMKAVNKGETVYGENVRFPGRFKIIEMGELFATVDYEDGTEPMEMASMNIRIDSLQFESAEIEEGNAFGAARAEAIAKGEKTFKVGDEEYDVEDVGADDKKNAEEYAEEEGIATEAVSESASFKMGSVADRFRSLM